MFESRGGYFHLALLLLLTISSCSPKLPNQSSDANPLLTSLRGVVPTIQHVDILARVSGSVSDWMLVGGSPSTESTEYIDGSYAWPSTGVIALVSADRASRNIRVVKSFRHAKDDCCAIRVLLASPSEFVVSREAEKSEIQPNLKLWLDATGSVTSAEYMPFSIKETHVESGMPVFVAGDGSRFVEIRATDSSPFLKLVPGDVAVPEQIAAVATRLPIRDTPPLPQSTYDEFAHARAARVADGYDRANTEIREAIGAMQSVGDRVWFGKTFYDSEGVSGVGAFGYLDSVENKFHLFSPPDLSDWSVSAIRVEGSIVWLGLVNHGEWSDSSGGVLRVNTQTMEVSKIAVRGVINAFSRYNDRVYLSSTTGLEMILADGTVQHTFVDITSDQTNKLSISTLP